MRSVHVAIRTALFLGALIVGASPGAAIGATGPYSDAVYSTPDVAAYFPLGEPTSQSAARDAVTQTHGTYGGSVSRGQSAAITQGGTSVGFDGASAHVGLGDRFDFTGVAAHSVEFWIRPSAPSPSDYRRVLSKETVNAQGVRAGWFLYLTPTPEGGGNRLGAARYSANGASTTVTSSVSLAADQWAHVTYVFTGTVMQVYVNGVLSGSASSSISLPDTSAVTTIGGRPDLCCNFFSGRLDEVSFFTRALSAATVSAHRAAGLSHGRYADAIRARPGIAAYYRLGESSGNSAGTMVGSAAGTLLGGPTLQVSDALADDPNRAMRFDGLDDAVSVGDQFDFAGTSPFTFSLWMKPSTDDPNTFERIVSKESDIGGTRTGYLMMLAPSEHIVFGRYGTGGSVDMTFSSTTVPRGVWSHLAVTYDGSALRFYRDGALQSTAPAPTAVPNTTAALRFGGRSDGCCDWFRGSLDEITVSTAALTGTQVTTEYRNRTASLLGINDGAAYYGRTGSPTYSLNQLRDIQTRVGPGAAGAPGLKSRIIRASLKPTAASSDPEFLAASQVSQWDSYFDSAAARGLSVTAVLSDSDAPTAAIPTGTVAANYADAAAALAKRFGPGGDYWTSLPTGDPRRDHPLRYIEVWNEPYFMRGQIPNLAALLRQTYVKVKAANPNVDVLVPGEKYYTDTAGVRQENLFAQLAAAQPDIAEHFDGLAVHPYTRATDNPLTCAASDNYCLRRLAVVRQHADAIGGSGKPMVITEEGSSTCPSNPTECVTQATQSSRVNDVINLLRATTSPTADPWHVDGYLIYNYHSSEADPADREGWFGLTGGNSDTSNPPNQYTDLKPAWTTFQTQAALGL